MSSPPRRSRISRLYRVHEALLREWCLLLLFTPSFESYPTASRSILFFSPKESLPPPYCRFILLLDSAPIKKARFIELYNKAREEGLTEPIIRAGWKATGIWPWNPRKVIRSSQVKLLTQQELATVYETPRNQRIRILPNETISTPHNRIELQLQMSRILREEGASRSVRMLVRKTSKTLDLYAFKHTQQRLKLTAQGRQLEHLANKRKKKVAIDANTVFANIEDILKVQAEIDRKREVWERQDRAKEARDTANTMISKDMESFMHEFHVADVIEATGSSK